MRIKTTHEVFDELNFLKNKLMVDNNAQVLKIAIAYGMFFNCECKEDVLENGFEIDTATLFGVDEELYYYLIVNKYPKLSYRKSITRLIDFGIHKLISDLRYAKNDTAEFIFQTLEV